jgi:hypothetical protein
MPGVQAARQEPSSSTNLLLAPWIPAKAEIHGKGGVSCPRSGRSMKPDASSPKPTALGSALLEAARVDLDLNGAGQLFGPARFEEAGA